MVAAEATILALVRPLGLNLGGRAKTGHVRGVLAGFKSNKRYAMLPFKNEVGMRGRELLCKEVGEMSKQPGAWPIHFWRRLASRWGVTEKDSEEVALSERQTANGAVARCEPCGWAYSSERPLASLAETI